MKGLFTEMNTEQQWMVRHTATSNSGEQLPNSKELFVTHL